MKVIVAIALMLLIPIAALATDSYSQNAIDASKSWLALVDKNDYAQSWNVASVYFQNHLSQAQWERAVKAARGPMGPVVARYVAGVDLATTLPGAPDGQYVIVKFNTKFANKAAASETVTMMMDGGSWKAAGYYVR